MPDAGQGNSRMTKKGKPQTPEQIFRKMRDAAVMLNASKSIEQALKMLEVNEALPNRWRSQ